MPKHWVRTATFSSPRPALSANTGIQVSLETMKHFTMTESDCGMNSTELG